MRGNTLHGEETCWVIWLCQEPISRRHLWCSHGCSAIVLSAASRLTPREFSPNFLCICFIRDSLSQEFKNVHQPESWFISVYRETESQSDLDAPGPWPPYVFPVGIQLVCAHSGGGEGGGHATLSSEDSLWAQSRREIPDSVTLAVYPWDQAPVCSSADWPWHSIFPSGSFQSAPPALLSKASLSFPRAEEDPLPPLQLALHSN